MTADGSCKLQPQTCPNNLQWWTLLFTELFTDLGQAN